AVRELIYILKYLQKKDGSYRDVRVTKKLREELYLHLQKLGIYSKDKTFTDTIDKKMYKLLNRIFKLTKVKNKSIDKKNKINNNMYKIINKIFKIKEVKSENIGKKNKFNKIYKTTSLKNKIK